VNKIRLLIAVIITLMVTSASAIDLDFDKDTNKKYEPPKVLLDPQNLYFSGYWGVYSRYSKISDTDSWLMGARAGFIVDNHFVIGMGGMAMLYPTDMKKLSGSSYSGNIDTANFYYGGLLLEYYFNPKDLIVFSAGTLVGGGLLKLSGKDSATSKNVTKNNNCFTAEPEINIFINLTRSCRIGIGTSYRYVSGINSEGLQSKDFKGFTASAMVQLGGF